MNRYIAVDIGGTFTDLIAYDPERGVSVTKVPTTPEDPSRGFAAALEAAHVDLPEVGALFHGTTLGINTLLEGKGGVTGLITTAGFRDVLEIGRMNWPMYRLHYDKPPPLIPRRLRLEVGERILADGTISVPLSLDDVRAAAEALIEAGAVSVAVSFLNAYAHPDHERRVGELLHAEFPQLAVTLSHELSREFREYERTSTAAVDAIIGPRVSRYLTELESNLGSDGFSGSLLVTRSDGGVMDVAEARRASVRTLLSGPASGVMGAAALAAELELPRAIAADMGGTSFDAGLIVGGEPLLAAAARIRNMPLLMPVVDLATIGAGGGSIASLDPTGALVVGPESAAADPGPICYGKGGTSPTFTDAAVVSGLIDPAFFLGGEIALDHEAARRGIERLIAVPLGLDVVEAAAGIVAVAEAKMASTLEDLTVGKGLDPRTFALIAYGGGGPLVANALAARLAIPTVVIPRLPGAFSAWGMLWLDEVRDHSLTRIASLTSLSGERIRAVLATLEGEAEAAFDAGKVPQERRRLTRSLDMRYENQEHALTVRVDDPERCAPALLRAAFDAEHQSHYGYELQDPVELVAYRVRSVALLDRPPRPELAHGLADASAAFKGERRAQHRSSGGARSWGVFDRGRLLAGNVLAAPAIVEEESATTLVLPGYRAEVDVTGNLLVKEER